MKGKLVRVYQTLSFDEHIVKRELLSDAGVPFEEKISSGDSNIDYLAKLFVYNQPATGVKIERQPIYSIYIPKKEHDKNRNALRRILER